MRAAFRVDSSTRIGTGHLMRCLTLAEGLRAAGAESVFVCRELPGGAERLVRAAGFEVRLLSAPGPGDVPDAAPAHAAWLGVAASIDAEQTSAALADAPLDWLVVDSYALDARWERAARAVARRVAVIDDLADRPHDCDVLLDQNLFEDAAERYLPLVPAHCLLLLGPRYALLREEFAAARRQRRERDGSVSRVLVYFGGGDPGNETAEAVEALRRLGVPGLAADVVVSPSNPHRAAIAEAAGRLPGAVLFGQTDRMAELMATADLALGASGTASWERCYLGLPSVVGAIADNQESVGEELGRSGATVYLGREPRAEAFESALRELLRDPERLRAMSERCLSLMADTEPGAAHPLAAYLTGSHNLFDRRWCRLRAVEERDLPMLLAWRNDPRVRCSMLTDHVIAREEHEAWYLREVVSGATRVLVFELLGRPVGLVYFPLPVPSRPFWGFYLGETDVPAGTGRLLCLLGLEAAFSDPDTVAVDAEVIVTNAASLKVHEWLGFEQLGRAMRPRDAGEVEVVELTLPRERFEERRRALAKALIA